MVSKPQKSERGNENRTPAKSAILRHKIFKSTFFYLQETDIYVSALNY